MTGFFSHPGTSAEDLPGIEAGIMRLARWAGVDPDMSGPETSADEEAMP